MSLPKFLFIHTKNIVLLLLKFDEFWLLKDYEFLSTIIISIISPWLFIMVPEIKVKNQQGHT